MVTSTTQIESEPLDALSLIGWNKTEELKRARHNPANKVDFLNAVNLRVIVLMNVSGSGDQDDLDTAYALATPEAAIAAIDALANP